MGMRVERDRRPRYEQIHRALLAGLLGNVGFKTEEQAIYLGARGIKFYHLSRLGLRKKAPKWVMAAELTETTRLYARCVAQDRAGMDGAGGARPGAAATTSIRTGKKRPRRSPPSSASRSTG